MEDVKTVSDASQEAAVEEPTEQASQPEEQTTEIAAEPEKSIPYGRFTEVNKKYREAQRELAALRQQSQLGQYSPEDAESVMAHPMFQEMALKVAKQELTDYAREAMDNFPTLNPAVKKAILANVRGFVKEATSDVEEAKLDILEYIESIAEDAASQPAKKEFQVAKTNSSNVTPSARPADIMRILNKPMDEWSKEEEQVVEDYRKANPKK